MRFDVVYKLALDKERDMLIFLHLVYQPGYRGWWSSAL